MSRFRQLMIANQGSKYPANATVWEVTIPAGGAEYRFDSLGWNANTTIDWGDGTVENMTTRTPVHTYAAGAYTVVYTGDHSSVSATNGNAANGQYVTGVIQLSRSCGGFQNFLNASNVRSLPRDLLFDGITNVSNFLANNRVITALPEGFTFPDSVQNFSGAIGGTPIARFPQSLRFPRSGSNGQSAFGNMPNLEGDISRFFDTIPQSGSINVRYMFSNATKITGVVPADKLWENTNVTWNSTECFYNCIGLTNFADIPATWGGPKIEITDKTIQSGTTVDTTWATHNVEYMYVTAYGSKVTTTNAPEGLTVGNWGALTGTLAAGTYVFDVTVSNKWNSATATITLIVS